MTMKPSLYPGKITARQPTRKLVPGHSLAFSNSSFGALKKQTRTGHASGKSISGEIKPIRGDNGAEKSNSATSFFVQESDQVSIRKTCHDAWIVFTSFINTNPVTSYAVSVVVLLIAKAALFLLILLRNPKNSKWLHDISRVKYPFDEVLINGLKSIKNVNGKQNNTTSTAQNKNSMLMDIDLVSAMDVFSVETFLIGIGILLVWGVLYRLLSYAVRKVSPRTTEN